MSWQGAAEGGSPPPQNPLFTRVFPDARDRLLRPSERNVVLAKDINLCEKRLSVAAGGGRNFMTGVTKCQISVN